VQNPGAITGEVGAALTLGARIFGASATTRSRSKSS
jgi:hypothetical protein